MSPVKAQLPLKFENLGRNEGLSQSSVNCMLRDSEGFMWFGTQDGLNLWDGRKFKVFQNDPGDVASLSNNYVLSLCEDEEGLIWVGTMTGGLNVFDKKTETFTSFQYAEDKNSISENSVWTVLSDKKGNIWAGTSKGLNLYRKSTGRFTFYRPDSLNPESISTDMVVSLFQDHLGRIWAGTVEGLCLLKDSTGRFTRFRNHEDLVNADANIIWSVSELTAGEMITGTNNGVYSLDISSGRYTRLLGSPAEPQIVAWAVNTQQPGTIWVGTHRGLFRLEPSGKNVQAFLHDPNNLHSISDNNVWCLFNDPTGFLWAGTNNGICIAKTSAPHFKLISDKPGQPLSLSSYEIMAVLEDKYGNVWIGTNGGGLNCIDPGWKHVTVFNEANSDLQNDNVYALAEDRDGNIYIGNYQGGLHRYNPVTGAFHAYPMNTGKPNSLNNRRVLSLLVDKTGKVWIGTRGGGLNRLDPETGIFDVYQHKENELSGFPANTVLSLAQDSAGRIWAGTQEGGLALYLPLSNTFKTFRHAPGDNTSLSDNNVWALEVDHKGRLWAGTQGGLNVAENPGEEMEFSYFTTRDGLRNNYVLAVKEDTEGNIWMSSFNGLAKLDIKRYELPGNMKNQTGDFPAFSPMFSLFDTDHGLQDLEFNHGCSHKGYSGTMYFGGNDGLNYFSAGDVKPGNFNAPVLITGIKIFNNDVSVVPGLGQYSGNVARIIHQGEKYCLPVKITYLKELQLSYRESVITFEFVALDYANPGKNLYAYKLENFDDKWNFVGGQNLATYTNLDPGNYTLLIRGSNSDGYWNPVETSISVSIVPPFWKTAWFIFLSVAIALILFSLAIRRAFIIQRIKARKEKEFIELQIKTIKSQIDPHFAFNAINTIAAFIYSDDPDTAYDYFTRFAMMIRNILEDNEKISRPLREEIEFVNNYLELQKMRFKDKFEYSVNIGSEVPPEIQVPKMIIQSYAENAIKHGLMHRKTGGLLKINISKSGPRLEATIEDNGIGRLKAGQLSLNSTRKGYRIMEQIMELYRKLYKHEICQKIEDLTNEKGEPLGTRVTLTIIQSDTGLRGSFINKLRKNLMINGYEKR
jgi:ligand-binding sensor domain-containing protein